MKDLMIPLEADAVAPDETPGEADARDGGGRAAGLVRPTDPVAGAECRKADT